MATATQARPALAGRLGAQNLTAGAIVLAGVLWLIWNLIDAPSQFFNVVVIGVTLGAIYALIALGYTLVYGIIELINFAHGDLFMIGSVFGMHLMAWLGARDSNPTSWLVIAVVTVAAMAACGSINVIIERVAYRPLRYAPKLAPLITAIGVSFILQNIGLLWNGPGQVGVRLVLPHGDLVEISGVGITWVSVIIVCVTGPLLYVAGGWTTGAGWLALKLLIVVGLFLPIEAADYHLSHFGGNKERVRRATTDRAVYEAAVHRHWLFLLVSSPVVMFFDEVDALGQRRTNLKGAAGRTR